MTCYRIKFEKKTYTWHTELGETSITLWDDDVLTRSPNGTYTKHTGLCVFNLQLPDEDMVEIECPRLVFVDDYSIGPYAPLDKPAADAAGD